MNEKHAPCSGGACAAIVSFIDWNAVAAQAPPLHTISRFSTAFHSKMQEAHLAGNSVAVTASLTAFLR